MKYGMEIYCILILSWFVQCHETPPRGLFVMTSGSKSNMNFFEGIVKALVQDGHQITFISPYNLRSSLSSVKHIKIDDTRDSQIGNKFEMGTLALIAFILDYFPNQCISVLSNPKVQKTLEAEYDFVMLAVAGTDCFLEFTHKRKLPIIYINQNTIWTSMSERFGIPIYPIMNPSNLLGLSYPPTFWDRIKDTLIEVIIGIAFKWTIHKRIDSRCRELNLWEENTPPIAVLNQQPSFLIVNAIRALEYPPKALPPNVIYAGGIHIEPGGEMPKDIKEWLDGSGEEGFILFSLGTAVRTSDLKQSKLDALLRAFGSLRQRIIWKWDNLNIPNLPPNVKVFNWLPQQAILDHPNIRVFVTHGGLFSLTEASFFEVPIVGIPIYADQAGNVAETVSAGWGKMIRWEELEEDSFKATVNEVLNNKSFRDIVKKRSSLMKDWPTKPNEEVIYWINYIVRHKDISHLISPVHRHSWLELNNLDVWFTIGFCALLATIIFILTIKTCFKFIFKLTKLKRD